MGLKLERTEKPEGIKLKCSKCDCTAWNVQTKGKQGYMIVCVECGEKWLITEEGE